tara:strand:+ start:49 stop:1305 length:1257 start_codon:yes stop_codon:yes gene_type:complete
MPSFNPVQIEQSIIKQKIKLKKLSHNYKINFENIKKNILIDVEEIEKLVLQNKKIIPEIYYESIKNKSINDEIINLIKKRGCVVIRNVFKREEVIEWNYEIEKYIDENNYYEDQKKKAGLDQYFSDLQSGKPQIFGLYWSRPQIEARQSENMATVKSWLNCLWKYEFNNKKIFDPNKELVYADRIRRREGGDASLGLSPHCDAGSVERWIDNAFQKLYEPIFSDQLDNYDPFNAQFRDQTEEISSAAVSHVFRTFQGWLALTEQGPSDGTLQLIPIIKSMAYILTRALLDDVPDNSLCDSMPARALSVNPKYHSILLRALISIPKVYPGDTVWWHPDVVHAVEDKHHGKSYSNVIYVGSTPYCQKNLDYAKKQSVKFLEGKSPPDFAAEDYEMNYTGRATIKNLTCLGKKQMALKNWD